MVEERVELGRTNCGGCALRGHERETRITQVSKMNR